MGTLEKAKEEKEGNQRSEKKARESAQGLLKKTAREGTQEP